MNRLTNEKMKIELSDTKKYNLIVHKMFNKLSEYEDIEEICEKISKQIVYQKLNDGTIIEENFWDCTVVYNFKTREIKIYEYDFRDSLEIDKIDIEWSFYRERLENDK